jgi:hypothetical protein
VGCPKKHASSSSSATRGSSSDSDSSNGNDGVMQGPLRVFLGGASDIGTPLLFTPQDRLNGVARAFVATHRLHEKQGAGCAVGDVNCMALAIQGLAEGSLASHVEKVKKQEGQVLTEVNSTGDVRHVDNNDGIIVEALSEEKHATASNLNEDSVTSSETVASEATPIDVSAPSPPEPILDKPSADEGQLNKDDGFDSARMTTKPVAAMLKDRMKDRLMAAVEQAKIEAEEAAAARAEADRDAAKAASSTPMAPLNTGKPAPKPDGSWEFVLD